MSASFVLASLGLSTYGKEYARLKSSFVAASLAGDFEHPVDCHHHIQ
jgi:hypothetical protein